MCALCASLVVKEPLSPGRVAPLGIASWPRPPAGRAPLLRNHVLYMAEHTALAHTSVAESSAAKTARHVSKAARTSYSTRSYVWRGPHRGALAIRKKQLQQEQQLLDPDHHSDGNSSRRSSASGAAASDDDEVLQQQEQQQTDAVTEGPYASARQRDKEWAALTTWLRMNLHHPRTAKKLVLFVGEQDTSTGSWKFRLNPGLTWDDVSVETKLRLKTLPIEAEQAFLHKYPDRPAAEWGSKVQKYKPVGSSTTVNVCLKGMVTSLSSIYYEHEPQGALHSISSDPQTAKPAEQLETAKQEPKQQTQQQELQEQHDSPAHMMETEQPMHQQVTQALPVLGVPVGLGYMPSAASAIPAMFPGWGYMSATYAYWQSYLPQQQQVQMGSGTVAGVPAVGVPADVAAAAAIAAAGAASCRQMQPYAMKEPVKVASSLLRLPAVAVAAGDGTDSCAESATPVAARTSVVFAAAC
eukprot:GHUV01012654.1.p1 GENE.GHUV01012654.1~~GHUV01012654.1.p1  ORF type:complete len:468 (+),score=166.66 GHUV01012654.1:96-1499(+)